MLTLLVFLTGMGIFTTFILLCAIAFNYCIKKGSLYRGKNTLRAKGWYNLYVMAYSSIFSTMLMASLCFPLFAAQVNEPIEINIPTAQQIIITSAEEILRDIQTVDGINIFDELNNVVIRFENEDVFK